MSWKSNDANTIAVGANDGTISILDIRNAGAAPVHESVEFSRAVRKLLFNPDCSTQLAGCCDATEVKVFDTSKTINNIFENNVHTDFVRGLAWHKNELLTCSWDNTIHRHSITSEISAWYRKANKFIKYIHRTGIADFWNFVTKYVNGSFYIFYFSYLLTC